MLLPVQLQAYVDVYIDGKQVYIAFGSPLLSALQAQTRRTCQLQPLCKLRCCCSERCSVTKVKGALVSTRRITEARQLVEQVHLGRSMQTARNVCKACEAPGAELREQARCFCAFARD